MSCTKVAATGPGILLDHSGIHRFGAGERLGAEKQTALVAAYLFQSIWLESSSGLRGDTRCSQMQSPRGTWRRTMWSLTRFSPLTPTPRPVQPTPGFLSTSAYVKALCSVAHQRVWNTSHQLVATQTSHDRPQWQHPCATWTPEGPNGTVAQV